MGGRQIARAEVVLDGIACLRGGRLLFEGMSLALAPGEAAIVTGANGAGKSSLLRIVAGLLAADAGRVAVEGGVALDSELAALDPGQPLATALGFWARIDGAGRDDVSRALEAMGLRMLADVPVRLLSSGQRRRAGLARMVASGAGVWLLDEPGNGLDALALDRLAAMMAGHRAAGGIVFCATHLPLGLDGARALRL